MIKLKNWKNYQGFWIRVAVVIFRTHLEQMDLLLKIIQEKLGALSN